MVKDKGGRYPERNGDSEPMLRDEEYEVCISERQLNRS